MEDFRFLAFGGLHPHEPTWFLPECFASSIRPALHSSTWLVAKVHSLWPCMILFGLLIPFSRRCKRKNLEFFCPSYVVVADESKL